jgi:hypothetical protein
MISNLPSHNIIETNALYIDNSSSNLKLSGIFADNVNTVNLDNSVILSNSLQLSNLNMNETASTGKSHRVIRYCPKEKDIVFELECEYKDCKMQFNNMDLFLEHIDNHLNDYFKEFKDQMMPNQSKILL